VDIEYLDYHGREISRFAIFHPGEEKWEGWAGVGRANSGQYFAVYSGLMDLHASRDEALLAAGRAAMQWIAEQENHAASPPAF